MAYENQNHVEADVLGQDGIWEFTYKKRKYSMPIGIERQLISATIVNRNATSAKNILKNWKHEELANDDFIRFFTDVHIPNHRNEKTIEPKAKKKSTKIGLIVGLSLLALIVILIFCLRNCNGRSNRDIVNNQNNYNNTATQSTIPYQTQNDGINYGDSMITNKGNVIRFYGHDGTNYILETDVKLTQNELTALFDSLSINPANRFQLTFQHGELFATYAYVESGIIKFSDDAPKSKADVQSYVARSEYEDVRDFINNAYDCVPRIENDWDREAVVGSFKDAADRLEEYRVRFGNNSQYKQLKQYFYQRLRAKLGRTSVKTIDDGGKTVAQEIQEQQSKSQVQNSNAYSNEGDYYITKEQGACYTKEDLDRFLELALAKDYDGINRMISQGRIVVVGPEPCVMLDRGILTSKVKVRGKVLYMDSDHIKKR